MEPQKKILVIEDDPSLLKALTDKFRGEGFWVIQAPDGREGLKLALAEHPDMILLDIVMPKMDGLMALAALRVDKWGKDALVIILTNVDDAKTVSQALESWATDFIVKGEHRLDEVVQRVKERLKM